MHSGIHNHCTENPHKKWLDPKPIASNSKHTHRSLWYQCSANSFCCLAVAALLHYKLVHALAVCPAPLLFYFSICAYLSPVKYCMNVSHLFQDSNLHNFFFTWQKPQDSTKKENANFDLEKIKSMRIPISTGPFLFSCHEHSEHLALLKIYGQNMRSKCWSGFGGCLGGCWCLRCH